MEFSTEDIVNKDYEKISSLLLKMARDEANNYIDDEISKRKNK